ncbi:ATP-binding protein, partial [Nostoc sp. NMS4]|uniref:tetratricopeptide repeat-containing sensor histidine kinase n=1 Tax=Nostoc sp. NMS4 TaxID=2815390 RepID=UPI0025FD9D86
YIYFQYALALERLDKYEQAIDQLVAIKMETLTPYQANVIRLHLGRLHYRIKQPEKGNEYFEAAIANSDDKDRTLLYSARSILASNPHSERAVELLQQIAEKSPSYAQAFEMLTLNLSEEDYFDMVKTDTQSGLSDTEVLNRAMYHKIANEISILKGIAYRILRHSEQEDPFLSGIIQDIEDVFEEVDRRRAAQKSEIETIPHDHYRNILAVISKTAHDISDFVNNHLAIIESKTRRAMRKLQPHDVHYTQFEKLLTQLELTQTALSDLKAINEGITIKNHRFKVEKLFEKWEITPRIHQAQIVLDIQNGDSEFNGDEEKIKSALNELVENSLKHNSDQQNLTIRIASQNVMNPSGIWGRTIPGEQEYLFIEFADNGKGIPEDRKDWIFQPLKTTSQEGKGSGLGLFIIRKTLSKMNGYIRETGHNGARFEIYIPYTKEEA